jgi:hypothetical protein
VSLSFFVKVSLSFFVVRNCVIRRTVLVSLLDFGIADVRIMSVLVVVELSCNVLVDVSLS